MGKLVYFKRKLDSLILEEVKQQAEQSWLASQRMPTEIVDALVDRVEAIQISLQILKAAFDNEVDSRVRVELEVERLQAELTQTRGELRDLQGANREYGRQLADATSNRDYWYKEAQDDEAETKRLRRQLAVIDKALGDFFVPDTEDHGVYRLQKELSAVKRVAALWLRKAVKRKKELVHVRQDAQGQSDKMYNEIQKLYEECDSLNDRHDDAMSQIREYDKHLADNLIQYAVEGVLERLVKAEQRAEDCKDILGKKARKLAHSQNSVTWLETQYNRLQSERAKARRERDDWCEKAQRAKSLAALVNEETAKMLERVYRCTFANTFGDPYASRQCVRDRKAAHTLAVQIREALDEC